jgi:hypothetical protein
VGRAVAGSPGGYLSYRLELDARRVQKPRRVAGIPRCAVAGKDDYPEASLRAELSSGQVDRGNRVNRRDQVGSGWLGLGRVGGASPLTGARAFEINSVKSMLAIMFTRGMYDYSGEWAYRVGVPAKSGVNGGVVAVVNRQLGVATFSPRLDSRGNSTRSIA